MCVIHYSMILILIICWWYLSCSYLSDEEGNEGHAAILYLMTSWWLYSCLTIVTIALWYSLGYCGPHTCWPIAIFSMISLLYLLQCANHSWSSILLLLFYSDIRVDDILHSFVIHCCCCYSLMILIVRIHSSSIQWYSYWKESELLLWLLFSIIVAVLYIVQWPIVYWCWVHGIVLTLRYLRVICYHSHSNIIRVLLVIRCRIWYSLYSHSTLYLLLHCVYWAISYYWARITIWCCGDCVEGYFYWPCQYIILTIYIIYCTFLFPHSVDVWFTFNNIYLFWELFWCHSFTVF